LVNYNFLAISYQPQGLERPTKGSKDTPFTATVITKKTRRVTIIKAKVIEIDKSSLDTITLLSQQYASVMNQYRQSFTLRF